MKKKKFFKLISIAFILLLGFVVVNAAPSLTIRSEATNDNKINISWNNPYGDSKNYPYGYRMYKSTDGGSTYNTVSMWTENDEVKVLNIYPSSPAVTFNYNDGTSRVLPKSASLKIWMEGGTMNEGGVTTAFENYGRDIASGRQLIKVDPISYGEYNANPDAYLKDGNGNYKYDVVAFGTWDGNSWNDLTQTSANATVQFIKSGRGAFFGHDTLYEGTSPIAFNTLAPYLNITALPTGTVQYNGEINSDTGRGANGGGLSKVKIVSKSALTSYPWNIGDVGTVLTIPSAHNLQSANGKILMRFDHSSYSTNDYNNPENFFLTLNNNTAMSQTGHSLGASTEDERKILANSLFYLKQINTAEFAADNDIVDQVAPNSLSASFIGCPTGDEYKKTIKLQAQDRGNTYKYYVEGMPQTQGHGINLRSNTVTQEYKSGVDGFWYIINDSPSAITKPQANSANWNKASNNSFDLTTGALNNTKNQYVHYFSKDKSGNVSNESVYTIPKNDAPIITIQPKSFYENQYTTAQWLEERDKGLLATDSVDGILTRNVQMISDTTDILKPGTYKTTYKVKDSGCLTTIKNNTITVKFNNPPKLSIVDRVFYEGEYSIDEWYKKIRMKDISASDIEDGTITAKIELLSDTVNLSIPGDYQVIYKVTDQFGKSDTKTSKVKVKYNNPPVIVASNYSFYEDEITKKQWKNDYLMKVSANDVEDGNITDLINVDFNNVDPTIPGNYQVVYSVEDQYGKVTKKTTDVEIKYNTPPKISAENKRFMEDEYTQEKWQSTLIKEKISASDKEDGNITKNIKIISDDVDMSVAGFYHVEYGVTDAYGKKDKKSIEVEIVYNQLAIIKADNKSYFEGELTEQDWLEDEMLKDVSALDSEDGILTDYIQVVKNNVDVAVAGSYEVTYKVVDSGGKEVLKTIDVTIKPNQQPTLTIFAENKRFIEGEYTIEEWIKNQRMENVSATDFEDNVLTDKIEIISDNVKPNKAGKYEVTYKVTDQYGKSVQQTIKVTVEPNLPPVIHATERWFTTTDIIDKKELLKKVIAYDDVDGEITNKLEIVENTVKQGVIGDYTVSYKVVDSLNKETTVQVAIHVIEQGGAPMPPVDPPVPPSDNNAVIFANGRNYGTIHLKKILEKSDIVDDKAYESVTFGLYAKEDIVWQGHVILKKDSLVGIIHLNDNKEGEGKVYHAGTYYCKEIAVDEQYVLSDTMYDFEFVYE